MSTLFTPIQIGNLQLTHRIAHPPLTRFRNDKTHTPLPIVTDYYAQRASVPGTLLIAEGTLVSPRTGGLRHAPGLWSPAQIAQWRAVTDAVHAKGSYIFAQIFAMGRAADATTLREEGGGDVVSSSAVALGEGAAAVPVPVPREMTECEIEETIAEFAVAARNAVEGAGFDGVEVHAANGYLIDQFTQASVNRRADGWGGSVERRARFALEVIRAVVGAVGAERTGVRFSPFSTFQGMGGGGVELLEEQFAYLARKAAEFGLAFVHLVEPRVSGSEDAVVEGKKSLDFFFEAYGRASPIIVAGGYDGESAREAVDVRYKDYEVLVAIGRPFISNPDLPFRVKERIPLRPYEREHFYTVGSPRGYIDYDYSDEFKAAAAAVAA